ncbi:hypothetical protein [Nocardiopsis deserti]|uniref:hypothetical protein n=1 Tax=Nocardiopsis deserti TaxID=2605988 RepID=UPI001CC22896|nr:hypothetical protein [Nocardiopsis deserti]
MHGFPVSGQPAPGQPPVGYGFPGQVPPPPVYQAFQGMPGQAVAVRVLMFIGGPIGILLGAFLGAIALLGFGVGEMAGEADEGAFSFLAAFTGAVALVPLAYGIVSTTLASLMGRRRGGLLWGVVAFHGVASLILLVAVIAGDYFSLVPLAFAAVMIGLMLTPRVREFYLS